MNIITLVGTVDLSPLKGHIMYPSVPPPPVSSPHLFVTITQNNYLNLFSGPARGPILTESPHRPRPNGYKIWELR